MSIVVTELSQLDTAEIAAELLERLKWNLSANDDYGLSGSDLDIMELALHDRLLEWMETGDI